MARVLGLIIVPVTLYMFFFSIHFLILSNSGDGDGFMSTEFKQTLRGNYQMKDMPIGMFCVDLPLNTFEFSFDNNIITNNKFFFLDIAYGSTITIKHVNTAGG